MVQGEPEHSFGVANLSSIVPAIASEPRLSRCVLVWQVIGNVPPSTWHESPSRQPLAHTPLRRTPRESSSTHNWLRHCELEVQVAPEGSGPDDGLQVSVNCGVVVDDTMRTRQVRPAS